MFAAVLSHLGYQRLDFPYVHPSWKNDGEAVEGLDLCFMPTDATITEIEASLVVDFITDYYTVLPNKPQRWLDMVEDLKKEKQFYFSHYNSFQPLSSFMDRG